MSNFFPFTRSFTHHDAASVQKTFARRSASRIIWPVVTATLLQACSLTPIREAPAPIEDAGKAPDAQRAEAAAGEAQREAAPASGQPFRMAPPGQVARLSPTTGQLSAISFKELAGWADDNILEAWPAWLRNCQAMAPKGEPFVSLCQKAIQLNPRDHEMVRQFFEAEFLPYRLTDPKQSRTAGQSNTITGYYEPILRGARSAGGAYQVPLYKPPPDLITVSLGHQYPELRNLRLRGRIVKTPQGEQLLPYPSRAEIEDQRLLRGHEIAWVDDAVEAFFLQVQGSGKIQLDNGEILRLGYANQNGHPYKSIGRWLVEQGELSLGQASMQGIKNWVSANPHRRQELLNQNPSVVFFRELPASLDPTEGPLGSLGVPLTAGRSLAVDPQFVALGLPVFLRTELPGGAAANPNGSPPIRQIATPTARLMFAQDTGSAIIGAHRGDFYFGSGAQAGDLAGRMRYPGEMVVLIPKGLQR